MNRSMVGAVLSIIVLSGCAATERPVPKINFDYIHAANFESISQFYCERGRWPKEIDELKGFAADVLENEKINICNKNRLLPSAQIAPMQC